MTVALDRDAGFDDVANPGQPAQNGHHVAGDRLVRALGQLDTRLLGEVVQAEQAVDVEVPALQPPGVGVLRVVLIPDLADELFDQVLEGDDAGGAAVLIDDHSDVLAGASQLGQRREYALRVRQQGDLAGNVPDLGGAPTCGARRGDEVTDVNEAEHLVVAAAHHGKP